MSGLILVLLTRFISLANMTPPAVATAKAHGGHLAYTQGDGLMIYFGYPKAEEDDPIRAIRAAAPRV